MLAIGDQIVETYSRIGLVMALYRVQAASFAPNISVLIMKKCACFHIMLKNYNLQLLKMKIPHLLISHILSAS